MWYLKRIRKKKRKQQRQKQKTEKNTLNIVFILRDKTIMKRKNLTYEYRIIPL